MQKARSGPRPNPHRGAVCATERECLMLTALALFLAACLAGVVNALAGGGLLFTFPALVAVGVPPLLANATANIASWPGYVSAAVAMRRELGQHRRWLRLLLITGVTGGITGAALLKVISPGFFSYLVPWLLLLATLLFWQGKALLAWMGHAPHQVNQRLLSAGSWLIGVYGGFFGGGMGVMMMTLFSLSGIPSLLTQNALKIFLSLVLNTASVIVLLATGLAAWEHLPPLALGYLLGGYAGGRVMNHIPQHWLRRGVVGFGLLMSGVFFWRAYV